VNTPPKPAVFAYYSEVNLERSEADGAAHRKLIQLRPAYQICGLERHCLLLIFGSARAGLGALPYARRRQALTIFRHRVGESGREFAAIYQRGRIKVLDLLK
jgi:hypothetical protein